MTFMDIIVLVKNVKNCNSSFFYKFNKRRNNNITRFKTLYFSVLLYAVYISQEIGFIQLCLIII